MNIITVSREFGSGGRELGKRLADELQIAYYDKEILATIASKLKLDEEYVEKKLNIGNLRTVPVTFGRTFSLVNQNLDFVKILVEQEKIIKEIAEKGEDFVIVGRNADYILNNYKPFNLFVYADMESKIDRCRRKGMEDNLQKAADLKKAILKVDKSRKKEREIVTDSVWGKKENYHLCINTTEISLKEITPSLANYIKTWRKN